MVVDTNVLISGLLLPASVSGRAARKAVDGGQLLVSEAGISIRRSRLILERRCVV
jgi:predicted nucleic acid-binding protein